jgi:toluene monooxygenase electron transfer component
VQVIIETKAGPLALATLPGETILAAGLRQGAALPYECATGTCGTCQARLIDGAIDEGWPQAPGRQGLKAARREFLMCQAAPRTDCRIALSSSLPAWRIGSERPATLAARVDRLEPLTHDMLSLALVLERPMAFEAGQFALLAVPGIDGFRAYSMANGEAPSRRLDFIIKRKPDGGFSDWLFTRARPGDALSLFGPLGSAVLEPSLGHDLLMIVGGSGLGVALSILTRAAGEGYLARHRARLFFGVRTLRDAAALQQSACGESGSAQISRRPWRCPKCPRPPPSARFGPACASRRAWCTKPWRAAWTDSPTTRWHFLPGHRPWWMPRCGS